jgi:hypothetical protein
MNRSTRLIAAAAVAVVLLLALSAWLHSWGGVALVVVGAAGFGWYRVQVARGEAAEQFFGEVGEDTRMTQFQGGSPSEMPVDRGADARQRDARS